MKLIDLLNKIANNEIKDGTIIDIYHRDFGKWERYKYILDNRDDCCLYCEENDKFLFQGIFEFDDIVEIIEEVEKPKEIEEIPKRIECIQDALHPLPYSKEYYDKEDIVRKIEEIRKAVNYLLKKEDDSN